jgi:hypothetical protein
MSLDTLIADTRKAIVGDAANAHAVFTACFSPKGCGCASRTG